MDWMGRIMSDFSPHLNQEVQEFNDDLIQFNVAEIDEGLESIWEESSQSERESNYSEGDEIEEEEEESEPKEKTENTEGN